MSEENQEAPVTTTEEQVKTEETNNTEGGETTQDKAPASAVTTAKDGEEAVGHGGGKGLARLLLRKHRGRSRRCC